MAELKDVPRREDVPMGVHVRAWWAANREIVLPRKPCGHLVEYEGCFCADRESDPKE